jgi:hypothetical protein
MPSADRKRLWQIASRMTPVRIPGLEKGRQILAILLLKRLKYGVFDTMVELVCANGYRNSIRSSLVYRNPRCILQLAAAIGIEIAVAGFQIRFRLCHLQEGT